MNKKTRNRVEINDESQAVYDNNENNNNNNNDNNNNNIKFKMSMIRSNLCDYGDAYIIVKRTISVPNAVAQDAAVNNTDKEVIEINLLIA